MGTGKRTGVLQTSPSPDRGHGTMARSPTECIVVCATCALNACVSLCFLPLSLLLQPKRRRRWFDACCRHRTPSAKWRVLLPRSASLGARTRSGGTRTLNARAPVEGSIKLDDWSCEIPFSRAHCILYVYNTTFLCFGPSNPSTCATSTRVAHACACARAESVHSHKRAPT